MKTLATALIWTCLALAAGSAAAQDAMKKNDGMTKDGMMKSMTAQECKDHMAMMKDGMKKDDAMMKKDTMCNDMMKSDGMMKKDGMMKSDGMAASAPMKK